MLRKSRFLETREGEKDRGDERPREFKTREPNRAKYVVRGRLWVVRVKKTVHGPSLPFRPTLAYGKLGPSTVLKTIDMRFEEQSDMRAELGFAPAAAKQ
jgi:hypothetical protein